MEVRDNAGYMRAIRETRALIAQGRALEALALVEACSGPAAGVAPLRATVYSSVRDDRDALMKGVAVWRELGPNSSPAIAFQLASALQGVVDLTRVTEGFVGVLNRDRDLMREARVRYSAAADHEHADDQLKL